MLYHELRPAGKISILIVIVLVSAVIFSVLGLLLGSAIAGIPLQENMGLYEEASVVNGMKVMQAINSFGVFVAPALIFPLLFRVSLKHTLGLKAIKPSITILTTLLAVVFAVPFINWMAALNSGIEFPVFLEHIEKWMKDAEEQAAVMTKAFLSVETFGGYAINLLIIAVIPAVGEEFLFRGLLQPMIGEWTGRKHLSVWITAILFSALHLQFYGFFPRVFLGAFFGYLFLWSSSLWLPILAHFLNNAIAVTAYWLISKGSIPEETEQLGATGADVMPMILSAIIMCIFIGLTYKRFVIQRKPYP